ncbi:hypothetical protein CDO73_01990 [Saccharibacillus sp. O23]|uniref:DUF3219 family protein n=1 Tax=Saccharibacillus sp. O23 TaxID=2009338 RepID=UPI000B4E3FD6|nr:DUF3219 family protein [Saccharibacillus sp. O23]OWR32401.1 hypothetical protein CDO73_01990 [Saccharibacillus sp. O23]
MNTDAAHVEIWLDERRFEATGLREFAVTEQDGSERRAFAFDFKVTHEDYHDVTTLLYKGEFRLRVPALQAELRTGIHNYSTSLDNLYEKGAVGDYHLELIERA